MAAAAAAASPASTSTPLLPRQRDRVATTLLVSGTSVGIATTCTNPIDVVKVHLQLQRVGAGAPPPRGMFATAAGLVRTEGWAVLFRGILPAVARSGVYGGLRLGLYEPLRALAGVSEGSAQQHSNSELLRRVLAGSVSGGFAAAVANPLDLLKTRMQAGRGAAGGAAAARVGALEALRSVVARDGALGLWRGVGPSVVRSAALTASQCATYDEAKHFIVAHTGWGDSFAAQFTASMATGLVTTTATNPVDVVKTHMFVTGKAAGSSIACARGILETEGPRGFMKGWLANFSRLGPQTVITFLVVERLRMWAGLGHL